MKATLAELLAWFFATVGALSGAWGGLYCGLFAFSSHAVAVFLCLPTGALIGIFVGYWLGNLISLRLFGL